MYIHIHVYMYYVHLHTIPTDFYELRKPSEYTHTEYSLLLNSAVVVFNRIQ